MIIGHEGVGEIIATGGEKRDMFGNPVEVGDRIVWHRGVTCGRCYYCAVRRQPSLCLTRKVYGIMLPCGEPPHFNGCYAEVLYVRPQSEIMKLPDGADEGVLVSATCSGATSAHGMELAGVQIGDTVLVIGPGPLGIYTAAFCMEQGASRVVMFGTARGVERMKIAESFGCTTVNISETTPEDRRQMLLDWTDGIGPDVVFDAAGTKQSVPEAIDVCSRGGTDRRCRPAGRDPHIHVRAGGRQEPPPAGRVGLRCQAHVPGRATGTERQVPVRPYGHTPLPPRAGQRGPRHARAARGNQDCARAVSVSMSVPDLTTIEVNSIGQAS